MTTATAPTAPSPCDRPAGCRRWPRSSALSLAFLAVAWPSEPRARCSCCTSRSGDSPPWLLTVAFGIYAITLLATLLVAGSLSDHVGRRPVLIGALAVQVVAMLTFLFARDIGWIIVARSVQGIATGAAMSTFTASIVELAPDRLKKLGATIGSTAPVAGIALGALFTGLAVQFGRPPPSRLRRTGRALRRRHRGRGGHPGDRHARGRGPCARSSRGW